jgi:gliding motility associated protien GldN
LKSSNTGIVKKTFNMLRNCLGLFVLLCVSTAAWSQAEVESAEVDAAYRTEIEDQYNPNSINPIPVYEQHYKFRVWRNIDLLERQNKGFFSRNGEITKLILEAVQSGELVDIYDNDSLTTKRSKADFLSKLQQEAGEVYDVWNPSTDYYTDDIKTFNGKNYLAVRDSKGKNPETSPDDWTSTSQGKASYFLPGQISKLQVVEDVIFDRRRSRLYYDIQGISIAVPGSETKDGFDAVLGWFKYKDLEKVFRAHPKKAVWFNRQNTSQNKNFADAILLRLFKGVIHKIENPEDFSITEQYAGRPHQEAVWAMEAAEMWLMEKEHNLWEF